MNINRIAKDFGKILGALIIIHLIGFGTVWLGEYFWGPTGIPLSIGATFAFGILAIILVAIPAALVWFINTFVHELYRWLSLRWGSVFTLGSFIFTCVFLFWVSYMGFTAPINTGWWSLPTDKLTYGLISLVGAAFFVEIIRMIIKNVRSSDGLHTAV